MSTTPRDESKGEIITTAEGLRARIQAPQVAKPTDPKNPDGKICLWCNKAIDITKDGTAMRINEEPFHNACGLKFIATYRAFTHQAQNLKRPGQP